MNGLCRWLPLALVAALPGSGWAASSAPPPPALEAQLSCQRVASPGRILCELSIQAHTGKLVWSDALVVRAPAFARPLRSRFIAEVDASANPKASAKLALVAGEAGQGQLELLARGVVCREGANGEWCAPEVLPVSALVEVGPGGSPAPEPKRPL